jgi:hypothetical protein
MTVGCFREKKREFPAKKNCLEQACRFSPLKVLETNMYSCQFSIFQVYTALQHSGSLKSSIVRKESEFRSTDENNNTARLSGFDKFRDKIWLLNLVRKHFLTKIAIILKRV